MWRGKHSETRLPFLARALRNFDGPLTADLRDLAEGPSHTFFVEAKSGWSLNELASLLERKGIKVWGKMIVSGDIMFTVRQTQARWAQYTLDRAGVPIKPGFAFCASSGVLAERGTGKRGLFAKAWGIVEEMMEGWGL